MSGSLKRFLVRVWHLWGFWTVVLVPATLVKSEDFKLVILGVGAGVIWPLGIIRAVRRRESILFRIASLAVLGLAVFLLCALSSSGLDGLHLRPRRVPFALLVAMLVIGVLGLGAALPVSRLRERIAVYPAWKRHTIGFPIAVLATLLLIQFRYWLAGLAVTLWALVWLWFFLQGIHEGKPLRARLAGLGLTMVLLAAWPPVSLATHRDDIAEAVFRYQLADCEPGNFYLEVGRRDPGAGLLRRFADSPHRIKAASDAQCPRWEDGRGFTQNTVTDRETGESGTILRVDRIERSWTNPCAVAVNGGYYSGTLAASGNTYWVVWLGGRWVVVDEVLHWIS